MVHREELRRKERELARDLHEIRAQLAAQNHLAGTSAVFEDTALYGAILQSATDYALIAADLDGLIVEWNVGARNVLGWSQDDIVGRDIRIIFTPEDRQAGVPEMEMARALQDGHALDQRWHLRQDGSRFWADGRMMPLKDHAGQIRGYLKILRDETGRKLSEKVVAAQRNVLRTVTDHIDHAILQVDPENHVVFSNRAVERLFGWSVDDLHGRDLHEALHHHHPDGRQFPADDCPLATVLRSGEVVSDYPTLFFHRDGTAIPVICSSTPVITEAGLVGAVLSVQDGRRQHEADVLLRAEVRRHEVLAGIQSVVTSVTDDLATVFKAVLEGALELMPQASGVVIETVEEGEGVCRAAAPPLFRPVGQREPLHGSLREVALLEGLPVLCDDAEADPRAAQDVARHSGMRSWLVVPVPRHAGFVGTLQLQSSAPSAFNQRDILVAQVLVGHLATSFARVDEANALRDLRTSEERLQLALQASETIGIWDWDVENDLCYADPRFATLFSVDHVAAGKGLPMMHFASGIHPDDLVWVSMEARRAMANGGDYALEHRVKLPDESVRWLAARGRCYTGPDGRPRRFSGAVVDITERKRAEMSLRSAETTARLAVEAAGLGLWDYDPVADRMAWDTRCKAIFGLTAREEPTLDLVMQSVHPRSRDAVRSTVHGAMTSSRLVGEAQEFEILRRDDSRERWIEVAAQAFFADGRCNRIIGTVADITARKQLEAALREDEQRFRTMAESIPQLAWMATPGGELFWFNERWFDYTGTTFEAVRGQGWQVVLDPNTVGAVVERLHLSFKDGTPWEDTLQLRDRDGRYRWFLSRALPIRDEGGRILRWFGTSTDIDDQIRARDAQVRFGEDLERQVLARTEELSATNARLIAEMADRKRAEEALRQFQKMEAVGQLTGGIAHDFNNLLTGITGSLDLMRKRIDQGRVSELDRYMNAAMTSANRAAALTHRLLAFARRQPLDAQAVDANALVASMEELFRRTLGETIEIELDLSADLWTTLCDPHQLENALLNLVINARDAMPDGGRLLIRTGNAEVTEAQARTHPDRKPGQFVTLQVADTGVGIAPEVMARVFEPFFTTKPIGQGTGLGLSMIYGFARQSEGQVTLTSTVGEGTVFTLYMPRFRGQLDHAEAVVPLPPLAASEGETVLVVEDDAVVRGLVLDVLRDLGYHTLEAHDGIAGLAVLQGRTQVDLVVTDVGLPGLNGRQLAEMGRASQPHLKVLFITGYAENTAFGRDALDASMQMITKPFAVDALAGKISAMLRD